MRVAVILVWRPKNFPDWHGRKSPGARGVPRTLANDASAAPYTGIHLASLFPPNWHVTLVHESVRDVDLEMDVDAVFLSAMDFCAQHARWLAQEFRARKVRVIVGGLFATLNPGYFADVADSVVAGEAEPVMPQLIADLQRRALQPLYMAKGPADLSDLPVPRYDLVETDFQMTMSYEATRGCPFTCSFCVLSAIRLPYRRRPISNVIRDIQNVPSHWNWRQKKWLTFWDNNLGADRKYFCELCTAMIPMKRTWGTETSIDTITEESARLMGKAGCRYLYIGLESLSQDSLAGSNKKHNKVSEYKRRLKYLHDNNVMVMSIFLVGLDGDTPEYARRLPDLVHDIGVDLPVFSFAAPIEGTTFHRELQTAGRLLPGDILGGMDGMHLVYKPLQGNAEELELAMFDCMRRAYSTGRIARRVARRLNTGFWGAISNATANAFYAPFQRSLARAGRERVARRGAWPEVGFMSPREAATPLKILS